MFRLFMVFRLMVEKISVPRGTADILPNDIGRWQAIEAITRRIFNNYNYHEIRTPIFEDTRLFKRSLGQTSEVVNKQLLELKSAKEEGFALRPEGTASIVRAYIENSLDKKEGLSKLFYIGPMFRGERPQKGRLRQFHQVGAEAIGPRANDPLLDAEIIALCVNLLKEFGVKDIKLLLNTLGDIEDKNNLSKHLRDRLKDNVNDLCEDCQSRFERNVFRILDCKNESCRKIVGQLALDNSYLSKESREHYETVKEALNDLGIKWVEDPKLVRGLDYYTHTVFEITSSKLGSQDALCAGGRYNYLVGQLGGAEVPAVGFALGIERVILATQDGPKEEENSLRAFMVAMDDESLKRCFNILNDLRSAGVSSDMSFRFGSMKSLMREADKSQARYVLIMGSNELKNKTIMIKNMQSGEQQETPLAEVIKTLKG